MTKRITQHLIPALLALLVVLTLVPFIESTGRLLTQITSAITWSGVRTVSQVVKPGEVLEIVYTAKINKQCPSDLRGFLIASDGTVPVRFPVVSGGYRSPSDETIEIPVKIVIPPKADNGLAPLVSGTYIYRTLVTRYCPDGVEDDHDVPDAKFYLEVPAT